MAYQHTMSHTIDRYEGEDWVQIELEVDYDIEPYVPAVMPSLNYPGDPPEGGNVTDYVAYDKATGKPISLTDEEEKTLIERIEVNHEHED